MGPLFWWLPMLNYFAVLSSCCVLGCGGELPRLGRTWVSAQCQTPHDFLALFLNLCNVYENPSTGAYYILFFILYYIYFLLFIIYFFFTSEVGWGFGCQILIFLDSKNPRWEEGHKSMSKFVVRKVWTPLVHLFMRNYSSKKAYGAVRLLSNTQQAFTTRATCWRWSFFLFEATLTGGVLFRETIFVVKSLNSRFIKSS